MNHIEQLMTMINSNEGRCEVFGSNCTHCGFELIQRLGEEGEPDGYFASLYAEGEQLNEDGARDELSIDVYKLTNVTIMSCGGDSMANAIDDLESLCEEVLNKIRHAAQLI